MKIARIVTIGLYCTTFSFRITDPVVLMKKGYKIMKPLINDRKFVSLDVSFKNNGYAINQLSGWKNKTDLKTKNVIAVTANKAAVRR